MAKYSILNVQRDIFNPTKLRQYAPKVVKNFAVMLSCHDCFFLGGTKVWKSVVSQACEGTQGAHLCQGCALHGALQKHALFILGNFF